MIDLIQFIDKAKYQLQYQDYEKNTWTVPAMLTRERYNKFKDDFSVRKIAIRPIDGKEIIVVEPKKAETNVSDENEN